MNGAQNARQSSVSRRTSRTLSSIGLVAAASVVTSTAVASGAHAVGPASADADAPTSAGRSNGLDETTTLETCTANFGGDKVTAVGFFDSIANDGSLNRAKSGKRHELEYRIEDTENDCVVFDPSVPAASSDEVSCADTSVVIGPAGSFTAPKYEEKEKHFKQYWIAPKGKNRCYAVRVNNLTAFFRTK